MTIFPVVWSHSEIRMSPDRKWMRLATHQFNAVSEPFRIAYMKARIRHQGLESTGTIQELHFDVRE